MLKIEEVKAGDKLECIDLDGYLDSVDENALDLTSIVIYEIDHNLSLFLTECKGRGKSIKFSDIKYFKKKEQSQQYTFDDLINMSTKAVKDRLFVSVKTDFKSIIALWGVGDEEAQVVFHNGKHNQVNCEYIQRLYKESFVIESEEDVKKVSDDCDRITLANGELMPKKVFRKLVHDFTFHIAFKVLKGATVEQERGRDDRS